MLKVRKFFGVFSICIMLALALTLSLVGMDVTKVSSATGEETVTYTVTFYDYDDSVVATQIVEEGEYAEDPMLSMERKGFTFYAWIYDEGPWEFTDWNILGDLDLYAYYELDYIEPTDANKEITYAEGNEPDDGVVTYQWYLCFENAESLCLENETKAKLQGDYTSGSFYCDIYVDGLYYECTNCITIGDLDIGINEDTSEITVSNYTGDVTYQWYYERCGELTEKQITSTKDIEVYNISYDEENDVWVCTAKAQSHDAGFNRYFYNGEKITFTVNSPNADLIECYIYTDDSTGSNYSQYVTLTDSHSYTFTYTFSEVGDYWIDIYTYKADEWFYRLVDYNLTMTIEGYDWEDIELGDETANTLSSFDERIGWYHCEITLDDDNIVYDISVNAPDKITESPSVTNDYTVDVCVDKEVMGYQWYEYSVGDYDITDEMEGIDLTNKSSTVTYDKSTNIWTTTGAVNTHNTFFVLPVNQGDIITLELTLTHDAVVGIYDWNHDNYAIVSTSNEPITEAGTYTYTYTVASSGTCWLDGYAYYKADGLNRTYCGFSLKCSIHKTTYTAVEGQTTETLTAEDDGDYVVRVNTYMGTLQSNVVSYCAHNYGEVTYNWLEDGTECTATRKCSKCEHEDEECATITSKVTQESTPEKVEYTTYTATFTKSCFSTQTKVVQTAGTSVSLPTSGELEAGSYILDSDVTLTDYIKIKADARVTIDLNGHVLNLNGNYISNSGTLRIINSVTSTKHYFAYSNNEAWTIADKGDEFITVDNIVYGETVSGTIIEVSGGVITGGTSTAIDGKSTATSTVVTGVNFIGNKGTSASIIISVYGLNNRLQNCNIYGNYYYGTNGSLICVSNSLNKLVIDSVNIMHNISTLEQGVVHTATTGSVVIAGNTTVLNNYYIVDATATLCNISSITSRIVVEDDFSGCLGLHISATSIQTLIIYSNIDLIDKFVSDRASEDFGIYSKYNEYDELYYVYVSKLYTVTFDTRSDDEIPSQKVFSGFYVTKPRDPVREGYKFIGWSKNNDMYYEWDFDAEFISGTTTIYAFYEPEYSAKTSVDTITLESKAEGLTYNWYKKTLQNGVKLTTENLSTYFEADYVMGTATNEDGKGASIASYTFQLNKTSPVLQVISYYFVETIKAGSYIEFVYDGDSTLTTEFMGRSAGRLVDLGENKYRLYAVEQDDMVGVCLIADSAFTITDVNVFVVTTESKGTEKSLKATETGIYYAVISYDKTTIEDDGDTIEITFTVTTDDYEVYEITIPNGEDTKTVYMFEGQTFDVLYGKDYLPEKTGYTFAGWYYETEDGLVKAESTDVINNDYALSEKWDVVEYTITYVLNGGENNKDNPTKYIIEDEVTFKDPTKTGYTFAGWDVKKIEKGTTGNITVTASWEATVYGITYVLDGGTNNKENPTTYTIENGVTLSAPTKTGYTFKGWSDNGTIAKGSVGSKSFTASWEVITYNITYELDGGVNSEFNPSTYTVEDEVALLAPTKTDDEYTGKTGYIFDGWYLESTFANKVTEITKGTTGAKTFYAKWTVKEYTIKYVLNGGTNSSENPTKYTIEDEVTFKEPAKTGYVYTGKAGYKFNGWDVEKIEKSTTGDITVTANWVEKKTFVLDEKYITQTYPYDGERHHFDLSDEVFNGFVYSGSCSTTATIVASSPTEYWEKYIRPEDEEYKEYQVKLYVVIVKAENTISYSISGDKTKYVKDVKAMEGDVTVSYYNNLTGSEIEKIGETTHSYNIVMKSKDTSNYYSQTIELKLEHDNYIVGDYEWNDDHTSCKGKRYCQSCKIYFYESATKISYSINNDGTTTAVATFEEGSGFESNSCTFVSPKQGFAVNTENISLNLENLNFSVKEGNIPTGLTIKISDNELLTSQINLGENENICLYIDNTKKSESKAYDMSTCGEYVSLDKVCGTVHVNAAKYSNASCDVILVYSDGTAEMADASIVDGVLSFNATTDAVSFVIVTYEEENDLATEKGFMWAMLAFFIIELALLGLFFAFHNKISDVLNFVILILEGVANIIFSCHIVTELSVTFIILMWTMWIFSATIFAGKAVLKKK